MMRAHRPVAVAVGAVLGGLVTLGVGCQTYDFQPMSPLTVAQTTTVVKIDPVHLKPNLWLLVDRSGSMVTNKDACTGGTCTTRLDALKSAMTSFLDAHGDVARMALSLFPADTSTQNQCSPTNAVTVGLPPATPDDVGHDQALRDNAVLIRDAIQGAAAGGGTPTAQSVAYVATQDGLLQDDQRDDFILLLTDGLPNCNGSNPDDCNSGRCQCTTSNCTQGGGFCQLGCLDATNASVTIGLQKSKGVHTVVLAFGRDATAATGMAPDTLTAMATAGGTAFRTCHSDGDCDPAGTSGDTCTLGLCKRQYFTANNAEELAAALLAISQAAVGVDACTVQLTDPPPTGTYIAVINNGEDVPSDATTWQYTGNSVQFASSGKYCQAIMAKDSTYHIEIRYVKCLTPSGSCQ
jgi:hypothetical protein